jgi:hypothetical protein
LQLLRQKLRLWLLLRVGLLVRRLLLLERQLLGQLLEGWLLLLWRRRPDDLRLLLLRQLRSCGVSGAEFGGAKLLQVELLTFL